ncbi:biotin/lipoyl-containing protein [Jannaschia ovalis]|uniref:Pyruvate dehydrogenase n=1 Tax=Jannaschia ovalis TaxID=3038773 RepID=A0ABY8LE77_9RHOB|nr:biotin/lipoyl-containing protein [Jannaschia sp. GRR-S6-38]WGH79617.1 pyruvate dehydrogenase [Jannaschia sp. GRR-S6-38]
MPRDVIMPALGMAQDTGHIVAWHKKAGDAVAEGDVLFEVETDKATMEVEAASAGFLTDVTAGAGADVPVGDVIARISETAEGSGAPAPDATPGAAPDAENRADAGDDALPEGHHVIMPALGMAQDSGRLVGWHVAPGDAVAEGDLLFEVETDKATQEVEADRAGYVAALLAEAGEDVPTGQTIAILSDTPPANPVRRRAGAAPAPTAQAPHPAPAPAGKAAAPKPAPLQKPKAAAPKSVDGRILASPKLRRLALERGLDLARLAEAGLPQPYHVKDLGELERLSAEATAAAAPTAGAARRLTAEIDGTGFAELADWLAETGEVSETAALAGFAGAALGLPATVAVARPAGTMRFAVPTDRLGDVTETEDAPGLVLRDLRGTPLTGVALGPEAAPTVTLTRAGPRLALSFECSADQMTPDAAIAFLTGLSARLDEPLRHLL